MSSIGNMLEGVLAVSLFVGLLAVFYWVGWKDGRIRGRAERIIEQMNAGTVECADGMPELLEKNLAKHNLLPNIRTLIVSVVLTFLVLKYFPNP